MREYILYIEQQPAVSVEYDWWKNIKIIIITLYFFKGYVKW